MTTKFTNTREYIPINDTNKYTYYRPTRYTKLVTGDLIKLLTSLIKFRPD